MNTGIDSITIDNFQSHKHSELQFVPGVNVVIGSSDAGKSSIFRAINWVLTNRPLGDAFRSEWGGETKAQLQTADGEVVTRCKSESKNTYIIQGNELKAFGSNPPEDVEKALQVDEVNIQEQTEPPFLLANSPGEVAQVLNKAASIEDIDLVIRNLKRSHDHIRRDIQSGENWIVGQQEQLEQYDNLPELEKMVKSIESLERKRNEISGQRSRLGNILQSIAKVEKELAQTKNLKEVEIHYNKAEAFKQEITNIKTTRDQLYSLISNINQIGNRIDQVNKQIEKQQAEYNELVPEICPLCGNEMKEGKKCMHTG